MALQSSTNRIPIDVAAIIDESVERAGIDPATLDHRKLVSLMRSLALLTIEIEGSDADEEDYYDQVLQQFQAGQRAAILPSDTLDVLDAVALTPAAIAPTVNGVLPQLPGTNPDVVGTTKIPMMRISRAEDIYQQQVDVQNQVPLQYWITRTAQPNQQLIAETNQTGFGMPAFGVGPFGGLVSTANLSDSVPGPMMVVWPVPQVACTVAVNRLRLISLPGALSDKPDMRRNWVEALCAGLAWKAAQKYNVPRIGDLKIEWLEQLAKAHIESRERAPYIIGAKAFGRTRRRRF